MQTVFRLGLIGFVAASILGVGLAQEPKEKKQTGGETDLPKGKDPVKVLPFEDTDFGMQICASVALIGAGNPWGAILVREYAGECTPVIPGWVFNYDTVFPLKQRHLAGIVDFRPLPNLKDPGKLAPADRSFYLAYIDALVRSNQAKVTMDMFEKSSEENREVDYRHLRATPERFRGKIITVQGKLALIRREPAPRKYADADPSVKDIFTGWIHGPSKGAPPFTIVFTELPKGVDGPDEKFERQVTFYGYFLGHIRFPHDQARDGGAKDVLSPYLVGKTVIVQSKKKIDHPARDDDDMPFSYPIIATTLAGIVAIILSGAVLTIWFRRGDQKTQSQLAEVRDKHRPFTLEPDTTTEQPSSEGTATPETKTDLPPPGAH